MPAGFEGLIILFNSLRIQSAVKLQAFTKQGFFHSINQSKTIFRCYLVIVSYYHPITLKL